MLFISDVDERFRRDAINMSFGSMNNDDDYDGESDSLSYDDYNVPDTEAPFNTTIDLFNMTELISTTVASFLQNITDTLDPYNTTLISEQFTEFISTTISDENDSFDSVTETTAQPVYDKCIDNPNGWYIETVCNEVTNNEYDLTTAPLTNESPMEMRVPPPTTASTIITTTVATIFNGNTVRFPNASMTTAVNESFSPNLTTSTNVTGCVPFAPNKGDNITGVPPEYVGKELSKTIRKMTTEQQQKLRVLCWETLFGQELVKLTVLDLIFTIFATLFMDFFRALFVRFMNKCWCWDLEKKFPKVNKFSTILIAVHSPFFSFFLCFILFSQFC